MNDSIQIKMPSAVDHAGLIIPGTIAYKIGQYDSPSYAANLTTDNPDECYIMVNGVKKTSAYFTATETENDVVIHGLYWMEKLPTVDAKSNFNLDDFAFAIALTEIDWTINTTHNNNRKGNIENFSRSTAMTRLKMSFGSAYKSNVFGSINNLLDGMVANGRTSGSIYMYFENVSITYNGSVVPSGFSKYFDFDENGWSERT